MDRFQHERALLDTGFSRIAGVDEAGRGPLAGPVVAAAVCLPVEWLHHGIPSQFASLNDSKQLTARQREHFYTLLLNTPEIVYGIAFVEASEIDEINILRATHVAMRRAVAALEPAPDHLLVDGLRVKSLSGPQTPLVKGDSLSYSIAAASVLAKVTRDRCMAEHERAFPGYGFGVHKGYGTAVHLEALRRLGPCPIHRRSFAPLKTADPDLFGQ